ncbi:hypothetical protein A9Q84_15980 [Halobacteriovorax marinus]|uniref:Sensory/regulatory protein RpfC n=1 Tax=Halobacteriovorax marinus TaxID=97084 RepID=A0A1Y5F4L5_9BACT|nr:hypothetical protein A9Q84_15980 [Halobacteriovorax marinus]
MMGMNGFETTQKINEVYSSEDRPVIFFLTVNASEEVRTKCKSLRINDCLEKPVSFEILFDLLVKHKFVTTGVFPLEEDHLEVYQKNNVDKTKDQVENLVINILVVDDENISLKIVGKILNQAGFKFTTCNNGKEALKHFANGIYNYLLVDLQMPVMNGEEFIQEIRKINKNIPITVLTGHAGLQEATNLLKDYRISDFIQKPIETPERLIFSIKNALSKCELENRIMNYTSDLEKMVEAKTSSLNEALKKATESSEAKSQFLANMSHEIRTPLNGIIGVISLLRNTQLEAAKKDEYLETIRVCGHSLMEIINNILDFSKIEAHKVELEMHDFNLASIIESVISLFTPEANSKGVKLTRTIETEVPIYIHTDSSRLRQILVNLCNNALKFTKEGSISINVKCMESDTHNKKLLFSIADTGIGIAKEKFDAVFSTFCQADNTVSREYGGTGLGLAISSNLANLLGGELTLESEENVGSTFSFSITYEKAFDHFTGERYPNSKKFDELPEISSQMIAKEKFPDITVLIAEDHLINQKVAQDILHTFGIESEIAANGIEAIKFLDQRKFDLVFMDVQMPEMDGIEATKIINRIVPKRRRPKIVAMTANASKQDRDQCIEAGMDDYISKPITIESIYNILKKWPLEKFNNSKPLSSDEKTIRKITSPIIDEIVVSKMSPKLLKSLVELFLDEGPSIDGIQDFLDKKDSEKMWKAAHRSASACLTMGAAAMAELGREIERKGKNGDFEGVEELIIELRKCFAKTAEEFLKRTEDSAS